MSKIKKLNRKSVRTHIYNILKESSDFSSSTIAALIAAGDVDAINSAIQALTDSKRGIRQTMKSEKADSAAERTALAKKIIAYYLVKNISPADLTAAGDDESARAAMFHHVVPTKSKGFDPSTKKVVEKNQKFKLKTCEILVFWTFAEMGIELTGGTELRDTKNPANSGTDSARQYAKLAIEQLKSERLIIDNREVEGVRSTGLRMGVPSDADGLDSVIGDFDGENFRQSGPESLKEIRRMIINEFVSMAKDSNIDLGIDEEYAYLSSSLEKLKALAGSLEDNEVAAIEIAMTDYGIGEEEDDDSLDAYAASVNEEYLDEEIELGPELSEIDEDFDFKG